MAARIYARAGHDAANSARRINARQGGVQAPPLGCLTPAVVAAETAVSDLINRRTDDPHTRSSAVRRCLEHRGTLAAGAAGLALVAAPAANASAPATDGPALTRATLGKGALSLHAKCEGKLRATVFKGARASPPANRPVSAAGAP